MVIKRKDGTVYKLKGPNPMMSNQSLWEEGDKSIVHNFNPEEFTTKEYMEDVYENSSYIFDHSVPLEKIQTEEIKVQIKEVDKSQIPDLPKKKERIVPREVPKEVVHCLPAEIKESYDILYGENRNTLVYGSKFTMEIIIVKRNDLSIQLWSNTSKAGRGSVIYVPSDKRWWRVSDVVYQNEGHTMVCVPSDIQPSFE